MPSFSVACSLSIAALFLLVALTIFDASFDDAADALLILVGIREESGFSPVHWLQWNELGWRLSVLVSLLVVGLFASMVVAGRLFFGRAGGRSVAAHILATTVAALWLSFFARFDDLRWMGLKYRLSTRIAELNALGRQLSENWPRPGGAGTLPGDCSYTFSTKYHHSLDIEPVGRMYRFRDSYEWGVVRRENGTIHIPLDAKRGDAWCMLEFVPQAAQRGDFECFDRGIIWHFRLQGSVRLDDFLFLTWYTVSIHPA